MNYNSIQYCYSQLRDHLHFKSNTPATYSLYSQSQPFCLPANMWRVSGGENVLLQNLGIIIWCKDNPNKKLPKNNVLCCCSLPQNCCTILILPMKSEIMDIHCSWYFNNCRNISNNIEQFASGATTPQVLKILTKLSMWKV